MLNRFNGEVSELFFERKLFDRITHRSSASAFLPRKKPLDARAAQPLYRCRDKLCPSLEKI